MSTTIVIPIYEAYDEVKLCINSVIRHTRIDYDVLLMDDASPDPRISSFCESVVQENVRFQYFRQERNLGFVGNCNSAFQIANPRNNVLLLNSDVIVTPGWLSKIIDCANSDSRTATVTPLTNNGEICSVPNWLEENDVPEGYGIDKFSELVEKISEREYPKAPTAVGFCMYIKREALNEVGGFDTTNFGKGYGEENDFCYRANALGYIHLIDDATFVFHAGSKSFQKDKESLVAKNSYKISEIHPTYHQDIQTYIKAKPLQKIIDRIKAALLLEIARKNFSVLFLLHNGIFDDVNSHRGGVEYHCLMLANEIAEDYPVCAVFPDRSRGSLQLCIKYKNELAKFSFPCQLPTVLDALQKQPKNQKFSTVLEELIQIVNPSIIHIHHLIGLSAMDVDSLLRKLSRPYVVSVHDYYLICPSYNLINYAGDLCIGKRTDKLCKTCGDKLFQDDLLPNRWLKLSLRLIENAELIIAPSLSTASILKEELKDKFSTPVQVVRHGIDSTFLSKRLDGRKRNDSNPDRKFKVAFIGSLNKSKGSDLVVKLLDIVGENVGLREKFHFTFAGHFAGDLSSSKCHIEQHGAYDHKKLAVILRNVHLTIIPSTCSETYCMTADESLAQGVPILTTPLGAVAERVSDYGVGWSSSSADENSILETLVRISEDRSDYESVMENVRNYPLVSPSEMAHEYKAIYRSFGFDPEQKLGLSTWENFPFLINSSEKITRFLISGTDSQQAVLKRDLRKPLSSRSGYLFWLKKRFPRLWEYIRFKAIKFRLVK